MQISVMPIDRIIPYARNPRNNEAAVAKVAASIREFGWRQPIVVDKEMVVIAGHTRLLAARQLGISSVPVHVAENLSDAQVKAYRIADNRTHEDSEWNDELLVLELGELKESDFDLKLTGFDTNELEQLLTAENLGLVDEDSVPEAPIVPVSKADDIWILGEHKLLCGDALASESYSKLLGDNLADMVFTDPPYNVDYVGGARERIAARTTGHARDKILNDNLGENFYKFLKNTCSNLITYCKGAIYICMASSELDTLHKAFRESGGHWSTFIIWAKNHFTLGNSDYHRQYEPILYGWPKGNKHFWCGDRNQADLWFVNKLNANVLHPTMKPIELVSKAIENSSKSRDVVLDTFGGSGSTLIACEKTGRSCRMMELEPKYCDIIIDRWQEFTGKSATLCDSGKTFQQIKQEREEGGQAAHA